MAAGPAPLSFGQEQLWFLAQLVGGSPVYNELVVVRRRGPLDARALERSFQEIVRRHDVWRTSIGPATAVRSPVQLVHPYVEDPLEVVDLGRLPPGDREAEAARLARAEVLRPFALERGPHWRGRLVRFDDQDHRLYLVLHHIMFDGFSISRILAPELTALYRAHAGAQERSLPELQVSYADYARWQRSRASGAHVSGQLAYWRERLAGLPALELPADHRRLQVESQPGTMHRVSIPRALADTLAAHAAGEGATLFMVLLASFLGLLRRYTGQDTLVVGTLSPGRKVPELMNVFGYFVNPLVLRVDVSGDPAFSELVGSVRRVVLDALDNDEVTFDQVVSALRAPREPGRNPLFQVMFSLELPLPPLLEGWTVTQTEVDSGTSKFDLSVDLEDRPEGVVGRITYRTDLFEAATVARIADAWTSLLRQLAAEPDRRLSQLTVLGQGERHRLLVEWNHVDVQSPHSCIHELFQEQARQRPEQVAVTFADANLTYGELDRRANQLAHYMRSLGVGPETCVGVCSERSLEMVVALLAVLKAGGAYVPLDPEHPAERLRLIIEETAVPAVLVSATMTRRMRASTAARLIPLDLDHPAVARQPRTAPRSGATPQSLAYVMYTSGSTGTPKGVMVEHRNVVRLVRPATYARLAPDEVLLQLAPLSFDASTFEVWGALLNGARLAVAAPGPLSPAELGALIKRCGVTTLWLTAGLFNQFIDAAPQHLSGVRQLLTGGEALSPAHCARALDLLPLTRLINGYGPTETTTFACCHTIEPGSRLQPSVPIGRPAGQARVYVLDGHRQPVPVGAAGELYIGGPGVARGYLKRPGLTAERFVPDELGEPGGRLYRTGDLVRYLPEGHLEFLGRVDRQVKIRGYRVEPGEVEAALSRHPALREVAVEPWEAGPGDRRLVAFIVPNNHRSIRVADLRAFLRQRLPDFMVPSTFVRMERLPLTHNGKVDRMTLPAPGTDRPELEESYVAPRTHTEEVIARIWRRVLGLHQVGVHDDFFQLGGHSLLAVRMVAEVERELNRRVTVASIFQGGSTVAGLASLIQGERVEPTEGPLVVATQAAGSRPPLFFVAPGQRDLIALRHFISALGPEQPVVGLLTPLRNHRFDREGSVRQLTGPLLAAIRERQPHGPYYLCGHSLAGLVAYEIAGLLRSSEEEVAWLGLLDTLTPHAVEVASVRSRRLLLRLQNFTERVRQTGVRAVPEECWGLVVRRAQWVRAVLGFPLPAHQFDYLGARLLARAHQVSAHQLPVDVFATTFSSRASGSPSLGWDQVHHGPLQYHVFPGGHGSLLREPVVSRVLGIVASRLAER